MFVKERDQHNDLVFSNCFALQNLYKFHYFLLPLKFLQFPLNPKSILKFKKSQTVEAVTINKSVSQSEKAVSAGFWCRNRAVSIWLQKPAPVKIWRQTHARRYDTRSRILRRIYGADFWRRFLERVSLALHRTVVRCERHFDMLKQLGMDC